MCTHVTQISDSAHSLSAKMTADTHSPTCTVSFHRWREKKKRKKKHNDTLPPVTGPTVYTLVSFSSSSTLPTRFCCGGPQQNKGKGGRGDLPFITFLSRAEWREARARRRDAVFMFQGHMRVFYIYQLCQTSHVCLPFWKHLQ